MTHTAPPPDGVNALLEDLTRTKAKALLDELTERETEVMIGLAHTKTRKQVANDLGISETRVAQLQAAAKRRLGVKARHDAVAMFVIARQLVDRPVYTEKQVEQAQRLINTMVSDQKIEVVYERIASREFREYLRDLRSSGPKAWTARYGPGWRFVAGSGVAMIILALLIASVMVAEKLDIVARNTPS